LDGPRDGGGGWERDGSRGVRDRAWDRDRRRSRSRDPPPGPQPFDQPPRDYRGGDHSASNTGHSNNSNARRPGRR
jgi:hypothetical protein